MRPNPNIMPGSTQPSVPPDRRTSYSPERISEAAYPMASVELVQPHESTWLGPRSPSEIEISLDTIPQMPIAMAYGETCLPPAVKKSSYCGSPTSMPPPPLPMITPLRGSATRRPASCHASRAATTPKSADLEYRFGSARPSCWLSPSSAGASSIETGGTHAATWLGYVETSNWVMAFVPLQPRLT